MSENSNENGGLVSGSGMKNKRGGARNPQPRRRRSKKLNHRKPSATATHQNDRKKAPPTSTHRVNIKITQIQNKIYYTYFNNQTETNYFQLDKHLKYNQSSFM